MLPNREGRFKASIIEHGVAETGPNKLATFICKFGLTEELVNGEWLAFGPEDLGLEITGYFYLEKRDGSINTVTIDSLKAAFGWDGRDPMWLQDADFARLRVQVKLEFELYEGKTRLKVRYVDAEDASPAGVVKADEGTRKSLNTRLGSKLRALAGGTPAPAAKPVGRPTAPPVKPPSAHLRGDGDVGIRVHGWGERNLPDVYGMPACDVPSDLHSVCRRGLEPLWERGRQK